MELLYPMSRMLDGHRKSVYRRQATVPPADTPCQTPSRGPGAQTATIAAIMRRLLTEAVHVGMPAGRFWRSVRRAYSSPLRKRCIVLHRPSTRRSGCSKAVVDGRFHRRMHRELPGPSGVYATSPAIAHTATRACNIFRVRAVANARSDVARMTSSFRSQKSAPTTFSSARVNLVNTSTSSLSS